MSEKPWFVYVIQTEKANLYTGITTDVKKRFASHKSGKGAKFFRTQKPKKIVYTETFESKGDALRKEAAIKKLSSTGKRKLFLTKNRKPTQVRP